MSKRPFIGAMVLLFLLSLLPNDVSSQLRKTTSPLPEKSSPVRKYKLGETKGNDSSLNEPLRSDRHPYWSFLAVLGLSVFFPNAGVHIQSDNATVDLQRGKN